MPDSKFSTIYIPRQTRVILEHLQATYHEGMPIAQIVHRAVAIYNRKAEYREGAAALSTEEPVIARPGARARKVPRDTKKAEPAPAKPEKAQASPPASQSNGPIRPKVPVVPAFCRVPGTAPVRTAKGT